MGLDDLPARPKQPGTEVLRYCGDNKGENSLSSSSAAQSGEP